MPHKISDTDCTAKFYVAYYRVSTQRQGQSGLGLEAQQLMIRQHLQSDDQIIAEFTEIESGKKSSRPELEKAISLSREKDATLIIAKLDRLSRDIEFTFSLKNSGIDFVCCDLPEANTLTIGMMATFAQYERERISERTKAALAAKKARGFKLGTPENLTPEARAKGRKAWSKMARGNTKWKRASAMIRQLRSQGKSLKAIARELNEGGFKTAKDKQFTAVQVRRLIKRMEGPK
jgi:DNA invertase Pin-like site-specific DNA recombinase